MSESICAVNVTYVRLNGPRWGTNVELSNGLVVKLAGRKDAEYARQTGLKIYTDMVAVGFTDNELRAVFAKPLSSSETPTGVNEGSRGGEE